MDAHAKPFKGYWQIAQFIHAGNQHSEQYDRQPFSEKDEGKMSY
jgi:hypothetical protein